MKRDGSLSGVGLFGVKKLVHLMRIDECVWVSFFHLNEEDPEESGFQTSV